MKRNFYSVLAGGALVLFTMLLLQRGSSAANDQTARENQELNRRIELSEQRSRDEIGTFKPWLGEKIPDGWIVCKGQPLSSKQYPELFAVLGERFGKGEGASSDGPKCDFNLPDLRGVFLRGLDDGRKIDSDPLRTLGSMQPSGTALPRNAWKFDALQPHVHPGGYTVKKNNQATPSGLDSGGDEINTVNVISQQPVSAGTPAFAKDPGGDPETRPTNIAVLYVMKVR